MGKKKAHSSHLQPEVAHPTPPPHPPTCVRGGGWRRNPRRPLLKRPFPHLALLSLPRRLRRPALAGCSPPERSGVSRARALCRWLAGADVLPCRPLPRQSPPAGCRSRVAAERLPSPLLSRSSFLRLPGWGRPRHHAPRRLAPPAAPPQPGPAPLLSRRAVAHRQVPRLAVGPLPQPALQEQRHLLSAPRAPAFPSARL